VEYLSLADDSSYLLFATFVFTGQKSGTTVTFVIIEGWVVTVASVGDSRCVLESSDGEIYYLSADHRLDTNEEEYVVNWMFFPFQQLFGISLL